MFTTQEQYEQAEAELKSIEEELTRARADLAAALDEKETIQQFYNLFVARVNGHKAKFKNVPNDGLKEWAITDNELELEKKAIDRRYNEVDKRVEELKEEVRANDESRRSRARELALMKMPEGKAWHLRKQDNLLRGK